MKIFLPRVPTTVRTSTPRPFFICQSCAHRTTPGRRSYATEAASEDVVDKSDIYDIVCVGGGPAGLSILTALKSNPTTASLRMALVEAQDLGKLRAWKPSESAYSNRCSSLTPSSVSFLSKIGAWDHVDESRVQPYHEMQIWDGVSGQRIEFSGLAAQTESGVVASMIENINLTHALLSRLDAINSASPDQAVHIVSPTSLESITHARTTPQGHDLSAWPKLNLRDGKTLVARLLIGADGANSPVRTFASIPTRGYDYDRHGVVATLDISPDLLSSSTFRTAYQRFLPTGPIALLPLPGARATMVWSTTTSRAAFLKTLGKEDLIAMVNAAFRLPMVDVDYMHTIPSGQRDELLWRMEHVPLSTDSPDAIPPPITNILDGTVASFPLKLRHADSYISPRVALVGDAAHTVHPLAGQGLNAGQGDAKALAECVARAAARGMDIGSLIALEGYSAERYAANHAVLGVCDKLHWLYSAGSGPVVGLRSLGLGAVNAMTPLKNWIMRQAAGA